MSEPRLKLAGRELTAVLMIALGTGVLVALARGHPTGTAWADVLITVSLCVAVVWAGSSAPWLVLVAIAALSAVLAARSPLLVVAAASGLIGLWLGWTRSAQLVARALSLAGSMNVLARLGNVGRFGWSAGIGLSLCLAAAFLGARRRSRRERRIARWIVVSVVGFVCLAGVGFAVAAGSTRGQLEAGNRSARLGVDQLSKGDFAGAQVSLRRASDQFRLASLELRSGWAAPASVVPVLAQHRRAIDQLASVARDVAGRLSDELATIDPSRLRLSGGQLDVEAIARLDAPLSAISGSLTELADALNDARSPWLVGPVAHRLTTLSNEVSNQTVSAATALGFVRQTSGLLGSDRPRVYFVALTTPAEARGLGGFMGSFAELTITNGKIRMTRFGQTEELVQAMQPGTALTGPDEFLRDYGQFGFKDADGLVSPRAWMNVTMSPDFPTVAKVIAQLYPRSGGKRVDGVVAMDIYALSSFLKFTGPISLEGVPKRITAANAAQFFLVDQYQVTSTRQRKDMLQEFAERTMDKLLSIQLPPPAELFAVLGPKSREGRLLVWTADPSEQAAFSRTTMAGALPALDGGDGLAVAFNNAAASKIDAYLDNQLDYRVTYDEHGNVRSTATLTMHNSAPSAGLPDYVISNAVGLPRGWNRTLVTVYSALPVSGGEIDGRAVQGTLSHSGGWNSWSAFIDTPPGGTRVITLQLGGVVDGRYRLVVRTPPTAREVATTLSVNGRPVSIGPPALVRSLEF